MGTLTGTIAGTLQQLSAEEWSEAPCSGKWAEFSPPEGVTIGTTRALETAKKCGECPRRLFQRCEEDLTNQILQPAITPTGIAAGEYLTDQRVKQLRKNVRLYGTIHPSLEDIELGEPTKRETRAI